MKKLICLAIVLTALLLPLWAQNTANLVSIDAGTHINEAIQVLDYYCLRETTKRLLNMSTFSAPIGLPINNLHWKTALELIALRHNLVITEGPGLIALNNPAPPPVREESPVEVAEELAMFNNKQVRIKAVALVADRGYMSALGIDWSTLLNGKVNVDVNFLGAQNVPGGVFGIGGSGDTNLGNTQVQVSTLLRTIETNQKGTIIAQPVVMVNSGSKGFIQVGQDISVKTVDDAGNTTDEFFATGIIMDVTPTVVEVDNQELIHLTVSIERSSGTPGAVSTIINKSVSTTELLLYDGEETVIAGLYDTDEIRSRGGIPILKDLPWWVFGIRYLTGYTTYEKKERELLIMIKAEIVENALSRQRRALEASRQNQDSN
ncbi:MAG: type II and III secretion system protein [Candidatus Cloacimonadota bacterium]